MWALDLNAGFPALERSCPAVKGAALNMTDSTTVNTLVERIRIESSKIDVLVNNAGITRDAMIQKMTDTDWDAVINVNLKGVFIMTGAVVPIMMEAGKGSIVSIRSIVGLDGNIGQTNYAATKGGRYP
ncbi:MAG: SDR family NAD(P)-dependent oxidoreductase [Spirochaetia bacterium]